MKKCLTPLDIWQNMEYTFLPDVGATSLAFWCMYITLAFFCLLNVGVILYAHISEAVGARSLKVCSSRVSVGLLEPVYQRDSLPLRFLTTFVPDVYSIKLVVPIYTALPLFIM